MHEPKLCWWTTKVGEKISPLPQKDVYIKEKQRFLDHFFDPGNPYTFLPNTCHLCQPHVLHSLRSARPTEKNSSWRGKARQLQHIKERMQLLFDGFNMLQYDNMVQYGSKSWWFSCLIKLDWVRLMSTLACILSPPCNCDVFFSRALRVIL